MKRNKKFKVYLALLGMLLVLFGSSASAETHWTDLADELCNMESSRGTYYFMRSEDKLEYFQVLVDWGISFPEEVLNAVNDTSLSADERARAATDAIMQWLEITDEHDVIYFFVLEKTKGLFDYWPLEDKHALTEIRSKHLPLEKMPGYWLLPGEGDASYEEIREKSLEVLEQQFGLGPEESQDLVFVAELYQRSEEEPKEWEVYFHIKERSWSELYFRTIAYRQTWTADGTLLYAWQEEDAGEWWSPHDYDYLLPEPSAPVRPRNATPVQQSDLPGEIAEDILGRYPAHLVEAWDVSTRADGSKIYAIALWKEEGAVLMIYKEEDGQFSVMVDSQTALLAGEDLNFFALQQSTPDYPTTGRLVFGYRATSFFSCDFYAECDENDVWVVTQGVFWNSNMEAEHNHSFDAEQGSVRCTGRYPLSDDEGSIVFKPLYRTEGKDAFDLRRFNIKDFFDIDFSFYALPE